jgi:acyl-CoA dehydrogenase
MDFLLPAELIELRDRVAEFVRGDVIPREREITPAVISELRDKARRAGVYGPQIPREFGGLELGPVGVCVIFETAGRSFLGPLALNCAAPDEGNIHLLHTFATPEQREKYLRPLAEGKLRSCFAMTEPSPGAGSDPTMMQTRATRTKGGWEINGRKWFATGADGSAFALVMSITDPNVPAKHGATIFIVPTDTPGFQVVRNIATMGEHSFAGHGEIELNAVRVPDSAVLGEVGQGFRMAQLRLGPARLTHCMRWLGIAERSLDIAVARARQREAFGKKLAEHEAVQWMIADSEIDLHASHLMVMQAAWKHEQGDEIRHEAAMCKVFVAEAINRVIDRAIQICGALGLSEDTPLEHFYREARSFRIYDGPSEVHRMVIARNVLRGDA